MAETMSHVVGGSYVGLEFAQIYRRFGSAVTVVEMQPRLIAREDEDVSGDVAKILEQEGIDIRLSAKCLSVARNGNGISVTVDCAAGPPQVSGSHLLLAVGRPPNPPEPGMDKSRPTGDQRGHTGGGGPVRPQAPGLWALCACNRKGAL